MSWTATCIDETRIMADKSCPSASIGTGCAKREFLLSRKVTRRDHKESGSGLISLNQVPAHTLPTFSVAWGLTVWQWREENKDMDILIDNRISWLYMTVVEAMTRLRHARQEWCCKARDGIKARLQKAPALCECVCSSSHARASRLNSNWNGWTEKWLRGTRIKSSKRKPNNPCLFHKSRA